MIGSSYPVTEPLVARIEEVSEPMATKAQVDAMVKMKLKDRSCLVGRAFDKYPKNSRIKLNVNAEFKYAPKMAYRWVAFIATTSPIYSTRRCL